MLAEKLENFFLDLSEVAIAVSGGIDSMVLSAVAHQTLNKQGKPCRLFHAISPAVPKEATARVKDYATKLGWQLTIVDANEFADKNYRLNPVNRCFYCKTNLYQTIAENTDSTILSGTNVDDLGDYRPGLLAAENFKVRHPYVECGIGKNDIRLLAPFYGLELLADLPASPCLSSRVETGISIESDELVSINRIESFLANLLPQTAIRCRLRATGVVLEIENDSLWKLQNIMQDEQTVAQLSALLAGRFSRQNFSIAPYKVGSAFVH